jgi:hypothetical protein
MEGRCRWRKLRLVMAGSRQASEAECGQSSCERPAVQMPIASSTMPCRKLRRAATADHHRNDDRHADHRQVLLSRDAFRAHAEPAPPRGPGPRRCRTRRRTRATSHAAAPAHVIRAIHEAPRRVPDRSTLKSQDAPGRSSGHGKTGRGDSVPRGARRCRAHLEHLQQGLGAVGRRGGILTRDE